MIDVERSPFIAAADAVTILAQIEGALAYWIPWARERRPRPTAHAPGPDFGPSRACTTACIGPAATTRHAPGCSGSDGDWH